MLGWKAIQLVLAVWEILIGLQIVHYTIAGEDDIGKKTKLLGVLFGLTMGMLLMYNRTWSIVSWSLLIFNIIVTFAFCAILIRKQFVMLFSIIWSYYSIISILEIFFCFICMLILQNDFHDMVYMNNTSILREVIYLVSCGILTIITYVLKRLIKKINVNIFDYRYIVYGFAIVLYVILWNYHSTLDDMVYGVQKMQSATVLSLLLAIVLVVFVGIVVFKYKLVEKENETLILKDEMSRKNYEELSYMITGNERLRHDMKNHFLIINQYAHENNVAGIHHYIASISKEYFETEFRYWTGNDILDIILSQKRKRARDKEIEFIIEAVPIGEVRLDESEISSLFGNLLDNALEAAEHAEERWVSVNIKKQWNMFFIEIENSYETEPIMKSGEYITSKSDKNTHGYGLKSVKRIVSKYDGKLTIQVKEKRFLIQITFCDMEK